MKNNWGIMFSGQGAQKTGMGLDCYSNSPIFKTVIDNASDILGWNVVDALKNQNDELSKTKFVQPSLVAVSVGLYKMLIHDVPNLNIKAYVGLSLGEYSALIASQKLNFDDGMRLLKIRANAMQKDSENVKSAMAAVLKPTDTEKITEICNQLSDGDELVQIANYNSPSQVVLGGTERALEKALEEINEMNLAGKTIQLKVSGAFHTPLYQNTKTILQKELENIAFTDNDQMVFSNTTGKCFDQQTISEILAKQVINPTHFNDCIINIINKCKVDSVLEIGSGKALTKFAKQIDPALKRSKIDSYRSYLKFIENMGENK